MDETLQVESVHGALARPWRVLGLRLTEWAVIGLLAGQVLVYTNAIPRKLWGLKLSHVLFLATALGLYRVVLRFYAQKPPRYLVHALRFSARPPYLIARGVHEAKTEYGKSSAS